MGRRSAAWGSPDKEKAKKAALKEGAKVLWKDDKGLWHGAKDRNNTPLWALETEDLK